MQRDLLTIVLVLITLVGFAAAPSLAAEEPKLDLKLSFSADGGKTYSTTPQLPANPKEIKLRVSWDDPRPAGENDPATSTLSCAQSDFASARTGKQNWNGVAWFQRPSPSYVAADKPQQFDYTIDIGERPAGVMGYLNKWDPNANKQVDAPLPACPALAPGKYTFTIRVSYWRRKATPNRRVDGTAEFTLSVGAPSNGPTTKPAALPSAKWHATADVTVVRSPG